MYAPKRIAVIGAGVSGLSCAWLLGRRHQVTLFEKDDRFGGHANTQTVALDGQSLAVDTGFMVFNPVNYPNLVELFRLLEVPTQPTDMSFSVTVDEGRFEYAGSDLNGLLAQRRNLIRPTFWALVRDILRFYRQSPQLTAELDETTTLGELLDQQGYSRAFRDNHLLPMGAAIWSTPMQKMLDYPALTFMRFCANHGLLQLKDRPQWFTPVGGSRVYVERLLQALGGIARCNAGVRRVRRQVINQQTRITVLDREGIEHPFDQVVFACHPDQALTLLNEPTADERVLLGAFRYERNRAILHSDVRLMPKRRAAWASWNYLRRSEDEGPVAVTYWMNRLQHLPTSTPLLVTLNPSREPAPAQIHAAFLYDHPLFDRHALAAQQQLWRLQGVRGSWYCGAWFGYGFHEDGLQAGLAVAEVLGGVERPWEVPGMYDRLHLPADWRMAGKQGEAA